MSWSGTIYGGYGLPRLTKLLLVGTVTVYLLQALSLLLGLGDWNALLGISVRGVMQGHLWQFLTYQFLHGGPFHLLMNMLMLFFLGGEVERTVGRFHFLALYFLSGILGGLGWVLLMWPYEGVCVGASGAIFGLLAAFATLYPQREITLLLFFVFPVTMRAWGLAVILGALQFLMMVSPYAGGVAYSAHLAGGLAGFVYVLILFRRDLLQHGWRGARQGIQGYQSGRRAAAATAQRAEIDRLLGKVSREGLHRLTPSERRYLEKASARLRGESR